MDATANPSTRQSFVMHASDIETIWTAIERHVGTVKADVGCSDEMERSFTHLGDLLAYDNPRARAIQSICFTARDTTTRNYASITFRSGWYGESMSGRLSGAEDVVLELRTVLSDLLDAMKPWYWFLTRVDFVYLLFAAFAIVGGLAAIIDASTPDSPEPVAAGALVAALSIVFASCAAAFALVWILNRVRTRYFPVGEFVLGQGVRRHGIDENVRWVVLVGGVGLPLLLALAGAALRLAV